MAPAALAQAHPITFVVRRSEIRGRFDAPYNWALRASRIHSAYPLVRLREVASFKTGGTPSKSKPEYWEGHIPWASPKDFRSFFLLQTEDHISEEAVLSSSTSLVPPGSLLIVFRSGILQHSLPVTVTTTETAINQDVKAVLVTGPVSAEYLGAFFTVFGPRLLPLITKSGATVQSINSQQFEELEIPVPGDRVQKQVSKLLLDGIQRQSDKEGKAQALIGSIDDVVLQELGLRDLASFNRRNAKVFTSRWHALSGRRWDPNYAIGITTFLDAIRMSPHPVRRVGEFIDMAQYGISERATSEVVGTPMLRMLNLQDGNWDISDLKYIEMNDSERNRYLLRAGDILFNRTNSKELVGKCNVFTLSGDYVFASYLIRVRLRSDAALHPEFVVAYLSSSFGRMQIDAVSRQIAGMTNINAEEVRNFLIPVPPTDVQENISSRVAAIRESAFQLVSQARADLEDAKKRIELLLVEEGHAA